MAGLRGGRDQGDTEVDALVAGAPVDLGELVVGTGEAGLSPSISPSQPSRSASAMRAVRLSRISAMRGRRAGSGQSTGQRMQDVLVDAGGGERAAAVADGQLAAFEVAEELFPFFVGGGAVFLGGAQRAAAGQERQVVVDDFLRVGGLVAEGDVDVAVPGDDLGDVRREPGQDRVGDEQMPAEVVRVKVSGCPAASVRPVRASAALSMLRTVPVEMGRSSVPPRRWNSSGAGRCQTCSWPL